MSCHVRAASTQVCRATPLSVREANDICGITFYWVLPTSREACFGAARLSGRAIAGHIGALARFEYTVIGDPVNEAARLTELAKMEDGHVLASAVAVSGALDAEALCWDVAEVVALRGRTAPTQLARPLNLAAPTHVSREVGRTP